MTELLMKIEGVDFAVLDFLQTNIKNPFLDAVMPFITNLAAGGVIWIVLAIVLLCIKSERRTGIAVSAALFIGFIVCNVLLKNIVARTRPFDISTAIQLLITRPADFSFPSGHTTSSFAAASALLMRRNRYLGIPAIILAAVIAFSRLYLYVHYPSDVLAGVVAGVLAAAVSCLLTRPRASKR